MRTLIGMTDFVLEQKYTTTLDMSQIDFYDKELAVLSRIRNYANFLKQELTLNMFVPTDEDGNVLEIPDSIGVGNDFYLERAENQYKEAKEKVLFEGFERFNEYCAIHSKHKAVYIDDEYCQSHIVEDLINHEDLFSLTESALKQIGL